MALVVAMSVVGIARSQFPNFSLETTILGKSTSGSTVPAGDDNHNGPGNHLAIRGGKLSFTADLSLTPSVGGVAQVTLLDDLQAMLTVRQAARAPQVRSATISRGC